MANNDYLSLSYLKDYEPVGLGGAVKGLYLAVLAVFVAFAPALGLALTAAQTSSLVGLGIALEFVVSKWERSHVYPVSRVDDKYDSTLADEEYQ